MQQPQLQAESLINNPTNYVQSSAAIWPNDYKFRDQLSFPLTLALSPIELENDTRSALFAENKINQYRCHSCKAFINKYCTIRSKFQYDCSICGCTNRVLRQIDSLAIQMVDPVYTCISVSPQHRVNEGKTRTIAFIIDLTQYGKETSRILNYVVSVVRNFIKQVQQQESMEKPLQKCQIEALIIGFDDYIYQYRIVPTQFGAQLKKNEQKSDDKEDNIKYQIQKIVDTYSSNQSEDIFQYKEKQKYFIQIPKHKQLLQEILSDMLQQASKQNINHFASDAFLSAIERVLKFTAGCVGKIFVISGYRQDNNQFIASMEEQPEQQRSNFTINKQKCLPSTLLYLIQRTQMAMSFFIYNNQFINIMPIFTISKLTNGELKLYNQNQFQQFYYQFYYSVCNQYFQLGTQAILKVRHSSGVKLVGIFGQYRNYKGVTDQIQLLSCPDNRIYVFQFKIEGKVQQPYLNIQFSILWTDRNGHRIFKILTYCQKLSNNRQQILESINYGVVNQSYLWAIIHNMDLNTKIKTLQLTLQERCRKHIKAIQTFNPDKIKSVKRATPYIMFSYYLMRHFIMNTKYSENFVYDKSIETRSRIITGDISGIHTVWPAVYKIGNQQQEVKVVEMRYEQIKDAKLAVVIDQGDYCHVHILPPKLRKQVNHEKINSGKQVFEIISQIPELRPLAQFLRQLKQEKCIGYVQIILMESLQGICILDQKGPLSYSNFVNLITS